MTARVRSLLLAICAVLVPAPGDLHSQDPGVGSATDVIVVGAGIGGLSAALEAGRSGLQVTVIDMFSVFGGHAVMSEGGLALVDTPYQRERGVVDSPELAARDFQEWGVDANEAMVNAFARESRELVYDWLVSLGVEFSGIRKQAGNSVARFHENRKRGLGIVGPIYRECLRYPNIAFEWNLQALEVLRDGERVAGVRMRNLRNNQISERRAKAVVLATGGFQSSYDLVRKSWPQGVPFPENLLLGSGLNAVGSGLALASEAGGAVDRMDHQWNYPWGMRDPRFPGTRRGLNARIKNSVWINAEGRRFVNEVLNARDALSVLLRQNPPAYWAVFDDPGKHSMSIAGTNWVQFARIEKLILNNPDIATKADSIAGLARAIGVPANALTETVQRYNAMVDAGEDDDFHRFGSRMPEPKRINDRMAAPPRRIETPPFYAIPFAPITRKSMGGIRVDVDARVLAENGEAILGLYAVGEVTGFGGVNGSAGLEGTFLAPSMFQGRRAGRRIAAQLKQQTQPVQPVAMSEPAGGSAATDCQGCHPVAKLISAPRPGYQHFELVHGTVLERGYPCIACHVEMAPFRPADHKVNRLAQAKTCATCHLGRE